MAGTYDLQHSSDGQFYFNLKAGNSKVILTSERYTTKANAIKGIKSVRKNSPLDGRYDRRTSSNGAPYFVLKAANGEPIGRSELYSARPAMENGIRSVKINGPSQRVDDQT
jgi:uncharacterized protein YegP (UPF0339 family)